MRKSTPSGVWERDSGKILDLLRAEDRVVVKIHCKLLGIQPNEYVVIAAPNHLQLGDEGTGCR